MNDNNKNQKIHKIYEFQWKIFTAKEFNKQMFVNFEFWIKIFVCVSFLIEQRTIVIDSVNSAIEAHFYLKIWNRRFCEYCSRHVCLNFFSKYSAIDKTRSKLLQYEPNKLKFFTKCERINSIFGFVKQKENSIVLKVCNESWQSDTLTKKSKQKREK